MRLTDLSVQGLKFDGTQKKYLDDAVPNFGVRVYKTGKSFFVTYGTERRLKTIGKYPAISLKDARREAQTFLATLSPEPSNITVSEALSAFISHCHTKNTPRTASDYKRLLNRHLPDGKLAHLTRQQLLNYLRSLQHVPGEQYHAVTAINVFLNWCVHNGYLDFNPIAGVRGLGRIEKRDRILTQDELRELYAFSQTYPHPFGTIVALCILTGQRRSEVGALRWEYIKDDVATLPAVLTKNRREHIFPIGHLTTSIVANILHSSDEGYLFPGRGEKPWNGWSKAKKKFDEGHTVGNYTLHDLRRTYASTHAQLGTPIHVIEKLLNHASGSFAGVAGIYNRYSYMDEMKVAVSTYENYLSTLSPS